MGVRAKRVPTLLCLDEDARSVLKIVAEEKARRGDRSSTGMWGMAEAVRWIIRDWERLGGFVDLQPRPARDTDAQG